MISIDQLALFLSAQGFLLTLLLFFTKPRALQQHPNFYLGAFIALESLRSYYIFILLSEAAPYSPPPTILSLFFLSGPAIYLYVQQIQPRPETLRPADLLHLLPWFTAVGIYSIAPQFIFKYPSESMRLEPGATMLSFITMLNSLVTLFYYLLSHRTLVGGNRRDPISRRPADVGVAPVVTFLKILIVTQCVELAFNLLCLLYPQALHYNAGIKLVNTAVVFYYSARKILSFGLVLPPHQESPQPSEPESLAALIEGDTSCEHNKEKYAKSGLDKERSEELWLKLTRCLECQKLYLDVELHLNKLAAELEIRPQLLSQVINAHSGKNFYEFICEYRINAAKLALSEQNNARRKLIDIAWSSGFSSHSAFFYHFKRHTGMTPSSFRQMRLGAVNKLEARRPA